MKGDGAMKNVYLFRLMVVLSILVLAYAGCAPATSTVQITEQVVEATRVPEVTTAPAATATPAPTAAPGIKGTLGLALMFEDSPYIKRIEDGAKQAAIDLGMTLAIDYSP